ncbi:Methylamine utilisation protein MauE [Micrococcus luteus]|uniref:Methylamine utilisation protein MauE n=1 Tax=Micrococcus luteus TaxID=1270 RepID=A0ABD7M5E4_MICLU|nr:MauE/DoxX family redox-associated membrane protein [Micrococcus luteus]SHL37356.1 Methylamine utilisation protein MauE [Micrococcus luteus]
MSALWAVALIMLLSGTAKLRSGEDVQATFTRLRVPRPFAAPALARAFPWLELLLAAALLQPFTPLRPVVGLAAVALFAAFLALVVRAQDDGVSCGCFGEASAAPISRTTVVRNVVFLALAVLALAEGIVSLAVHGAGLAWQPLTAFGAGAWPWALLVTVLLTTAAFLAGRESVPATPDAAPVTPEAPDAADPVGEAEPERRPFPDAVVVADGEYTGLHRLVQDGAVVALRLSTGCGSCARVIERLDEFKDALGPVRLRVLMPQRAPGADGAIRSGAVDASLVLADPDGAASQAIGLHSFPTAVLLGTDRLTAGGPVGGADDVLAFLEEIREIMTTELPAATDGSTATPEVRA